jgi:hypothetical protein
MNLSVFVGLGLCVWVAGSEPLNELTGRKAESMTVEQFEAGRQWRRNAGFTDELIAPRSESTSERHISDDSLFARYLPEL